MITSPKLTDFFPRWHRDLLPVFDRLLRESENPDAFPRPLQNSESVLAALAVEAEKDQTLTTYQIADLVGGNHEQVNKALHQLAGLLPLYGSRLRIRRDLAPRGTYKTKGHAYSLTRL